MKVLLVSEIIYALIGFAGGLVAALAVFAVVFLASVLPKKKKTENAAKRRGADAREEREE